MLVRVPVQLALAVLLVMSVLKLSSSSILPTKKPKRQAKVSTFDKRQRELNLEHKTSLWLRRDKDTTDMSLVSMLWCEVHLRSKYKQHSLCFV